MFDTTNRLTLVGTVSTFEWTNPHVIIGVDVPDDRGGAKAWTIELGSPSILMRAGWKFNALKPGDKVTLVINPLKNGQAGGLLVSATLADGRVLGPGGGQTTAPPVGGGNQPAAPPAGGR
jgi:hypothetical protein